MLCSRDELRSPDERSDIGTVAFRPIPAYRWRSCGLPPHSHLPRLVQPALPGRRLRAEATLRPRAEPIAECGGPADACYCFAVVSVLVSVLAAFGFAGGLAAAFGAALSLRTVPQGSCSFAPEYCPATACKPARPPSPPRYPIASFPCPPPRIFERVPAGPTPARPARPSQPRCQSFSCDHSPDVPAKRLAQLPRRLKCWIGRQLLAKTRISPAAASRCPERPSFVNVWHECPASPQLRRRAAVRSRPRRARYRLRQGGGQLGRPCRLRARTAGRAVLAQ